jgi:ribosomal protein S18 acetylase RimI-like enzyme
METVHIRKATAADLPVLRLFEQGVIEAERPFDPTLKETDVQYYDLQGMLTDENIHLVVAEMHTVVIGCGYVRIETSKPYLRHSHHGYLGFMYVLPDQRGKGINQKIMAALKNWASSKGVSELRLEVYDQNEAAIKAYIKAGFEKLLLMMRMQADT